jgi:hypothetical protein
VSFATVGEFRVGDVGWQKKCAKQLAFVWQNPEASTGLQYTFYTASHFVHTQEENKIKK